MPKREWQKYHDPKCRWNTWNKEKPRIAIGSREFWQAALQLAPGLPEDHFFMIGMRSLNGKQMRRRQIAMEHATDIEPTEE